MKLSTSLLALALALGTLGSNLHAQEAVIRANIGKRIPQLQQIDEVRKTNIPGIYEIRVNGAEVYYTDATGDHLFQGNLFSTKGKELRNLTEERVNKLTAVKFESLPFKDAFTIVRGNGARKVAVFEDPNCGYCKRFERDLQKVDNVTIYMFLYPILGADSTDKSKAIWCAKDKATAWQDWMLREQPAPAAAAMCDTSSLARNVDFGKTYRINGTPTLIFQDGSRVPGAIDAPQIEKHLAAAKGLSPRDCSYSLHMKARAASTPTLAPVHYQVEVLDLHAHLFRVTLSLQSPAATQTLRLPVWIPGSYLVREFAKHLQKLEARQGGKRVAVQQQDKARWEVSCTPGTPLQVQYEVYAFDNSVRTAWLDAQRGFFNGTSLCLQVPEQSAAPHTLALLASDALKGWSVATGLEPVRVDKDGFGLYQADSYDTLVDCPVEMGPFWSGSFVACGIPHRFVVAGAPPSFDGAQLLADTQAICEAELRFWHGDAVSAEGKKPGSARKKNAAPNPTPFQHYVFMLSAVHDGYGGLEHKNSTALICNRKDLPRLPRNTLAPTTHKQPEGYTTLLGLISHEYFHTWNVKRLRPAELATYDYTQENYTQLLWFFEGFTSYYDDLLLRRAKRIDNAAYLKLLTKTINQVNQTPGRLVQSVAQSSFDAWVKYYRQDENTANATVSYYTKGSLVGLCLDLTLRAEGKTTLDAVMRGLWTRCEGGPMAEADLLAVLQEQTGRSYAKQIAHWVHSTKDLPVAELLEQHGVQVNREPDQVAQQLGLRVKESGGLFIQQVLRDGPAEKAGFAAGDEWLAVQTEGAPWRMQTLDDLTLYTGKARKVNALVARDKRLLTFTLTLPAPTQAVRLSVRDAAAVGKWLDGNP